MEFKSGIAIEKTLSTMVEKKLVAVLKLEKPLAHALFFWFCMWLCGRIMNMSAFMVYITVKSNIQLTSKCSHENILNDALMIYSCERFNKTNNEFDIEIYWWEQ